MFHLQIIFRQNNITAVTVVVVVRVCIVVIVIVVDVVVVVHTAVQTGTVELGQKVALFRRQRLSIRTVVDTVAVVEQRVGDRLGHVARRLAGLGDRTQLFGALFPLAPAVGQRLGQEQHARRLALQKRPVVDGGEQTTRLFGRVAQ
ncbi:hypothetical protein T4E_1609 [Trichinella pseudospiralis]|uniref:Uncharacterized protein n=1 Tax=Trichinella pseudospiralis TaxID=6337 RepID=A0A0V0Y289_TRIPS|nr:hypothetical protein T4E_1609 [Trichinella pseudospiralis]